MDNIYIQKLIGAIFALVMIVCGVGLSGLGYAAAKLFYIAAIFGVYLVFTNKEILDI